MEEGSRHEHWLGVNCRKTERSLHIVQMLPNLTDLHSQHRPSGRQTLTARNTSIQRGGERTAKKKKTSKRA